MSGDAAQRLEERAAAHGPAPELAAMLDAVEDGVFLCEAHSGRVLEANRAGWSLLGRERGSDVSFADWSALDEGFPAAKLLEHFAQVLAGKSERLAWRCRRADGSRFWAELRARRAAGVSHGAAGVSHGAAARIVVTLRDASTEHDAAEALRLAEQRYLALVQSLPHSAILLCDHDLRLVLVDGPEVEATGFSKAAMEGKTIFEALPPEFAQLVESNLRRVLRGESFSAELPFRELWYAYNYLPIRDGAGAVIYGMILALNITEQRRAQQAERRSEERLAKIVQNAPEPLAIVRDADDVITYVNPAFESVFGWSSAEVVGKTSAQLGLWVSAEERAQVLELFRRENRLDSQPVRTLHRDGTQLDGLLSLRPIELEGVPGILTSFRDISEAQRARGDLEASEARLRALSDATFEGIGILDQGRVVDINEQLAVMYRMSREELLGCRVMDLVAPQSLALVRSRIEQRLEGAYEHLAQRHDGSVFPVEVRARSVMLGGRHLRVTAIRDMTERKRADAERERLIAELTARNAEMEQFTYTVSHDLKSPLVTINGFLGALERDLAEGDAARVQSDLGRIRSASAKMSALLNDLLELSRVGRIGGAFLPVAMAELAREAEELVGGFLSSARVQLSIAPDLPVVRGDRARLLQVLQNLFENAAKYMGDQPEPRVELGARAEGEHWLFFVRDNGIGIDPRYAERIFGLFEKLDPRSQGTGIGLALVRRIIEFHGGRIWVESDGRAGSTFLFRLPRTPAVTEQPGGTSQP
jgi:PAS domain S-box-containing protein